MEIEKIINQNVAIIRVHEKRLDSNQSPELKKQFFSIITQDTPNLAVNLSDIEFMDSSGLGSILFGQRQAERFHGNLVIIQPSEKVKKLIEIAHLTKSLTIVRSEKEAIQFYQKKNMMDV